MRIISILLVALAITITGCNNSKITKDNIGRPIAIVIDGRVYSAPTVNCAIEGGRSQITGGFNEAEAKLLADRIQASVGATNSTVSHPAQHDKRRD